MPRKLQKIVNIVDVEATCWEPYGSKPANEEQNIIEIGICTLDITTPNPVVGPKRSILVHPARSSLSEFCTKLTTITESMIKESGVSGAEAFSILDKEYDGRNRVWASWGDFDRKMFEKESAHGWIKYPFGPRHINLKCLFSLINGLDHELAMPLALKMVGHELTGTHHRGHDDAENIAKIAASMFKR
jgi:inhibitor of KinA sporulation pathway (predicted exonuclease)